MHYDVAEKERHAKRKEELAAIRKIKDPAEREASLAEFNRVGQAAGGEHSSVLPNPVLYPVGDHAAGADGGESDDDSGDTVDATGIPLFELLMRVDIQGKFGKEKSVLAFQNNFGNLPARSVHVPNALGLAM